MIVAGLAMLTVPTHAQSEWKPVASKLTTPWTDKVQPSNVLAEYPRPQMERKDWMNLNGLWDFAVAAKEAAKPAAYNKKILVPFPVEAPLSGVGTLVAPSERIWYRRTFTVPATWDKKRVLLNFEAVDWAMTAMVNGKEVGSHKGGYDPFTFDITDALKPTGDQELIVSVVDPSSDGFQPCGKQSMSPGGCFYTRSSGIWQTVWLEPVAPAYVKQYTITPDLDAGTLHLTVESSTPGAEVEATALDQDKKVVSIKGKAGTEMTLRIPDVKAWSPDKPFLYGLVITLAANGKPQDEVKGYFGMRKIAIGPDEQGITRILFNNKFLFQAGPLDQGFWPDGLHTQPCDAAIQYDLEMLKKYGFNMLRKHIKVESRRYYYWCDKLGLLVWQDMPAMALREPSEEGKQNFAKELERMIATHYNVPSIIMWVPFNESWGQHDTEKTVELVRKLDSSRLVSNASGWVDKGVGDILDHHSYPEPGNPKPEAKRASVVGEFGGLGFNIPEHMWAKDGWGYATFDTRETLNKRYEEVFLHLLQRAKTPGISAGVYTQTSDIEMENNGLMTYDRKILKIDPAVSMAAVHGWFAPEPVLKADKFIDEMSVELRTPTTGAEIRYTLDGSEPTRNSTKYDSPVILKKSCTITTRGYYEGNGMSRAVAYKYQKTEARKAAQVEGAKPGLFLGYYETPNNLKALPDFKSLKPAATFVAANAGLERALRADNFALRFEGWFTAPQTGVYTFYLTSDNGSRLQIGTDTIVDNDGPHGAQTHCGCVALLAGPHPLVLDFFQANDGKALKLEYEGPGTQRQTVPASAFSHKKSSPVACLAPTMTGPTAKFVGETSMALACPYQDAKIYYTLDGSEPGKTSTLYSAPVKITAATTVKARAFADDMTPSPVTTIEYLPMTPHKAVEPANTKPGIQAACYEFDDEPNKMPDFATLKPVRTDVVEKFDPESIKRPDRFALKYDGYVKVPRSGVYCFRLAADDEARLLVAGETVVGKAHYTDEGKGKGIQVGYVALEAGLQPLSLLYYQGNGGRRILLEIEGPGLGRKRVEGPMLQH